MLRFAQSDRLLGQPFLCFRLRQIEAEKHQWGKTRNPKTDQSIPNVVHCISKKVIQLWNYGSQTHPKNTNANNTDHKT